MKNQGCVADVFLERFGAALGCQMFDFGSENLQNIAKREPKGRQREPKGAKRVPKVSQRATKMHQKVDLRKRSRK